MNRKPPLGAPRIRPAAHTEQAYMNTLVQPSPAWLPVAANAVGFNIVWAVTVFGAAGGLPWAGPAALLVFATIQVSMATRPRYDLAAMAVFASAGLLIDSAWSLSGALTYAAGWPSPQLAPVWLVSLWASFSLTLGHSLAWRRARRRGGTGHARVDLRGGRGALLGRRAAGADSRHRSGRPTALAGVRDLSGPHRARGPRALPGNEASLTSETLLTSGPGLNPR